MTNNCLNCNSGLDGNFCSHCGQSSDTHGINAHFLWHDIQHGLFHFDKGILFTIKELFTRPGHSIREFLQGKRVKHFKPISFVVLLAGVYALLSHVFDVNVLSNNIEFRDSGEAGSNEKINQARAAVEWVSHHYSIWALIQIPIFSVGTYFGFKKVGYNFIEHLVIHAFITGQKLVIHLVAFPLYYLFNNTPSFKVTDSITDIICYAASIWTLFQLFNELSFLQRVWRVIVSFIISVAVVFILGTLTMKLLNLFNV